MRIAVFGATGRTGERVVAEALDRGHEVVAFVRDAEDLAFAGGSVTVVEGDAYTGDEVHTAVDGADAVVSAIGQDADSPEDLREQSGEHIADAMDEAGVDRFVTLVGAGVYPDHPPATLPEWVRTFLLKLAAGDLVADAVEHVRVVRETDLDWTVVRTPRLGDGGGTDDYEAGDIDPGWGRIDRADVAAFILDCIEDERFIDEIPRVEPV